MSHNPPCGLYPPSVSRHNRTPLPSLLPTHPYVAIMHAFNLPIPPSLVLPSRFKTLRLIQIAAPSPESAFIASCVRCKLQTPRRTPARALTKPPQTAKKTAIPPLSVQPLPSPPAPAPLRRFSPPPPRAPAHPHPRPSRCRIQPPPATPSSPVPSILKCPSSIT